MNLFSTIETIKSKSQPVTEAMVLNAYKSVKRGGKSGGIDDVSFTDFGKDLRANLYKIWNRMASGSYFPSAVKEVEIPKTDDSKRKTGYSYHKRPHSTNSSKRTSKQNYRRMERRDISDR